ncbi:MAG: hypothetical protein ABL903_06935 [Methylococcales bacterium]
MANRLNQGQRLNINDRLSSLNGKISLIMQGDGNLVLYTDTGTPLWASNTWGKPVEAAVMQSDGNFVCYDAGGHAYWSTGTWGHPGNYIILQDDGNLVVYNPSNVALWASNTTQNENQGNILHPEFPIVSAPQQNSFPGSGGHMRTVATIYKSGLLNAVTRTWEDTMLRGFKGAVGVTLLDENKMERWTTKITHRFGVDGRWIGTSDRTDNWSENVPVEILPDVRFIAIVQKWDPNAVEDINAWIKGLANVASELAPIIQSIGLIAAL